MVSFCNIKGFKFKSEGMFFYCFMLALSHQQSNTLMMCLKSETCPLSPLQLKLKKIVYNSKKLGLGFIYMCSLIPYLIKEKSCNFFSFIFTLLDHVLIMCIVCLMQIGVVWGLNSHFYVRLLHLLLCQVKHEQFHTTILLYRI